MFGCFGLERQGEGKLQDHDSVVSRLWSENTVLGDLRFSPGFIDWAEAEKSPAPWKVERWKEAIRWFFRTGRGGGNSGTLEQEIITVRQGKGGKDRLVPLAHVCVGTLRDHLGKIRRVYEEAATHFLGGRDPEFGRVELAKEGRVLGFQHAKLWLTAFHSNSRACPHILRELD